MVLLIVVCTIGGGIYIFRYAEEIAQTDLADAAKLFKPLAENAETAISALQSEERAFSIQNELEREKFLEAEATLRALQDQMSAAIPTLRRELSDSKDAGSRFTLALWSTRYTTEVPVAHVG